MDTTNEYCDYNTDEDDYIDMELSYSSSPQSREFEFQMSIITCNDKEATTTISPADELFYKGKLLPLHLPPRRLMVENLLLHSSSTTSTTTTTTTAAPCTTTTTLIDSCYISPPESCRVSCELKPDDDHFFEWSNELNCFINNHSTKTTSSWSKKLKLKHSILGQKLKASRAYLKSFFNKSACTDESSAKANCNAGPEKYSSNKYLKMAKRKPLGPYPTIATVIDKERIEDNVHRRSFSSAMIKRHNSPSKCLSSSSSSSSLNSSSSSSSFSLHELQFLRRSSSATEIEGSIEAAIAHCKKSADF